ncbi:MAG: hypothetical protein A2Y73_05215 [Chloroflexi bacterium RBG_13_56_8]|nr:MAG: hypothetical protein A2Y73_05215 [Chloroflexi bacterium RBG_13_56_8]
MKIDVPDSYERMPLSDATREMLLVFAAGDMARPLPYLDVDWGEVFQAVSQHGLLGLTHRYLEEWKSSGYPPEEFRGWVREAYRRRAIRMALMYREIGRVLSQLTESGLEYLVLKGPVLAQRVYPDPGLRTFNDLDLLVRERDWTVAHEALVGMGFKSLENLAQPPPKLVPQAVLYEQKYQHPQGELWVEVHYGDLLNTGLASRDVEGFWERAERLELEGVPLCALSLTDQLIHLCAHAHYHGYTRLNWFSDLAFLLRDHGARISWPQLIETVRREEAQVPVFYTLVFLQALLGVPVPADVLCEIRPDAFRLWAHERFLPTDQVLSLNPMPRPDFGFYFLGLLRRLLPDLLVMGRRGDKLRYLLRLSIPPREWLRYYYGLDDTSNLAIHYLLHPLKLMWHYLAEIAAALARLGRRLVSGRDMAKR